MKVLRIHVRGFGRLSSFDLDFSDGLNLVFAANEGGKSTLQRFLVALLYGQLRADLRTQRRLDAWVEPYKPWGGTEYGGTLWCRLADGKELEVVRTFGRDEERAEVSTATGELVTGQYALQRNGDLLFAQHHLDLPKALFESVAVIRENRAGEIEARDTLRDRIANLAQAGDERISVQRCLSRLSDAFDAIGSDRAPTRPLKQALDRIRALHAERDSLLARRKEFESWVLERGRLAEQVQRQERDLERARWMVRAAQLKELQLQVHALEELDREIRALREEMAAAGGDPGFPLHRLDELNQLEGGQEELQRHLREIRADRESARSRLEASAAERRTLESYADLAASAEADRVTEWFVSYLGLARRRDDAQQGCEEVRQEIASLEEALNRYAPPVTSPDVDWQGLAIESSEHERRASLQAGALADRIAAERGLLAGEKKRRLRRAAALGVALCAAAVACLWARDHPETNRLVIAGAALGAVLGLLVAAVRSQRTVRQRDHSVCALESEQARLRNAPNEPYERLLQAAREAGLATVEEFLAATRQAAMLRQRAADLGTRLRNMEHQQHQEEGEAQQVFACLREILSRVGLTCTIANLKQQTDAVRSNLRKFRGLDADYRERCRTVDALAAEETQAAAEAEAKERRLRAILSEAGMTSAVQFREECRKCRRLLELREKEMSRTREFMRLSGDRSLARWREDLQLAEAASRDAEAQGAAAGPAPDARAPLLPYLPRLGEAEQEEKRISESFAGLREAHARVSERVQQAFRNCRPLAEVEEDLGVAEHAAWQLSRNRKALSVALATIEALARRQQEETIPRLNRAVESRFLRICRKRYSEVKIDPDFQIRLREVSSGELRLAAHLSRGTQDQLYLALRFGVLDLLSNPEEPCPCLLDEPFAAYDRDRIADAFRVLEEEASRRQVLLFTCREDVRDQARAHGARMVSLA